MSNYTKIDHQDLMEMFKKHEMFLRYEKGGKKADFSGLDLSEYDLDFLGKNLSGCRFNNANLFGVDLSGANLYEADLSGANLTNAELCGTWMMYANVENADFTNTDFYKASVSGTDFSTAVNLDKSTNLDKIKLAAWNYRDDYKELSLADKLIVIKG